METSAATAPSGKEFEDPLAYLPCSKIQEYRRGETIHDASQPSTSIYLIINGAVKVSRLPEAGGEVLMDIYLADEFFGESAFVGPRQKAEIFVAVQNTKVMAWTVDQVEDIIFSRHPQLAIGLLQILTQRTADYGLRIESFSVDNIARRLARALLRFSGRLGHDTEDGGVQMMPFTHALLAQYIGTSREVVTQCMNAFRRQGHLSYSRRGIFVHRKRIEDWLASEPPVAT